MRDAAWQMTDAARVARVAARRAVVLGALGMMASLAACTGGSGKASLPPAKEKPANDAADVADAKNAKAAKEATPDEDAAKPAAEPKMDAAADAEKPAAAAAAPAASPTTAPEGSEGKEFRLTGQVEAPRRSQIAFRVTGFIAEVKAAAGTRAAKGEVLATLDDRDFVLKVDIARAKRDQAKVGFDSARKEWTREQELKKSNASTASVLDKVQASFEQARLAQKLAEVELEQAEIALKDTRLVAPYDCVVAGQLKDEGEYVQSGNSVFEVFDTGEPEVTLEAPERLLGKIEVGAKLGILVPSVGFSGDAEIVRVVPIIAEKTRTFGVTAKFAAADPRVVPGSYAEALIK